MPSSNDSTDSPLLVFSPAEVEAMAADILSRVKAREALVRITSESVSRAQFAKNDVTNMQGTSEMSATLRVSLDDQEALASTQNFTAAGLAALVAEAEDLAKNHRDKKPEGLFLAPPASFKDPPIYFESTLAAAVPLTQADLIRSAAQLAEAGGLLGAGDAVSMASSQFVRNTAGFKGYSRSTYAEFSMTARTVSGTGSGWAQGGGEDFSQLNAADVAKRAIDLAKRSENPVAVEPGRYTVILEPEAVAALTQAIIGTPTGQMDANAADYGYSVFSKKGGGNRIGQKMTDDRVQLLFDPLDPLLPFSPMGHSGEIVRRTYWIENGVLKNLAYQPGYAHKQKRPPLFNPGRARLEITAPAQTLEQMIASTKRGIWVHRLGGVSTMDRYTLLLTGLTRDGTFLIENGKVTKPIKNMRFSESPFFVLNKLEAVGAPVRAGGGTVCPRLKVYDFEFTSLSDAI